MPSASRLRLAADLIDGHRYKAVGQFDGCPVEAWAAIEGT